MRHTLAATAAALCGAALLAGCNDSILGSNANLNCSQVHSYTLRNTVNGSLNSGDCQLNDGSAVDYYRFSIGSGRTVDVQESSPTVDTYVAILDQDGNVVQEETSHGGGVSDVTVDLPAGTYYIAASTFAPGDYGPYTLTSDYF